MNHLHFPVTNEYATKERNVCVSATIGYSEFYHTNIMVVSALTSTIHLPMKIRYNTRFQSRYKWAPSRNTLEVNRLSQTWGKWAPSRKTLEFNRTLQSRGTSAASLHSRHAHLRSFRTAHNVDRIMSFGPS